MLTSMVHRRIGKPGAHSIVQAGLIVSNSSAEGLRNRSLANILLHGYSVTVRTVVL